MFFPYFRITYFFVKNNSLFCWQIKFFRFSRASPLIFIAACIKTSSIFWRGYYSKKQPSFGTPFPCLFFILPVFSSLHCRKIRSIIDTFLFRKKQSSDAQLRLFPSCSYNVEIIFRSEMKRTLMAHTIHLTHMFESRPYFRTYACAADKQGNCTCISLPARHSVRDQVSQLQTPIRQKAPSDWGGFRFTLPWRELTWFRR